MNADTDLFETQLRDAFDRLVGDEPASQIDPVRAIADGRSVARHRMVFRSAAVAAAVVTATAAVATTVHHGSTSSRSASGPRSTASAAAVHVPSFKLTSAKGTIEFVKGEEPSGALDAKIIAAVKANSPSTWSFHFGGGGTDAASVDGTADDGTGAGRIYVYTSPSPGTMTREPCGDPEYVAGSSCTETHLAGDAILSVRGLVDYQGIQTYEISLTHADGSGVGAEAGNFTLPPMPKMLSSAAEKIRLTRPTVTRPAPTYDADQLATIVEAVDAAVHS